MDFGERRGMTSDFVSLHWGYLLRDVIERVGIRACGSIAFTPEQ
jgi:hypothetical protein